MLELYQHNQIAYEAVLSQLERTGKAAVIHPTGTGKSFIAFHLAEQFPKMRVLWLAPSEHIFSTQMENAKRAGFQSDNVSFMTYTKLMMLGADELDGLCPDYVVLDEFHRCGAERWGESVEGLLSAYPNAGLLGLSATNVRYLDNQRDMAEELFAGSIASEMTLGEAIVRGILPAPKYVTTVYRYQKDIERYQKRINAAYRIRIRLCWISSAAGLKRRKGWTRSSPGISSERTGNTSSSARTWNTCGRCAAT